VLPQRLTTRRLFEVVLVLGLFAMAVRSIGDPDFWWHLRTGQQILATHSIPHFDFYSHTKYGAPWTAHEWLSEVIIYGVYRIAGYAGLIITFAVCIACAFWMAFLRSAGKPYVAGVAVLWGAIATIPFWGIRPQIFSFLLTSVFLYLLDRFDETGKATVLWWMPLLMVLWVNLHGGFAIGLALILLALVCKVAEAAWNPVARSGSLRTARSLAVVVFACLVSVVVNPNGFRMYAYPFETLASPSIQGYIQEWASPNFHQPRMQPFALLLIASFAVLAASDRRPRTRAFLLLIASAWAGLQSSRHIPLFALAAIPMLAAGAESWLNSRNLLALFRGNESKRPHSALNYGIALILVLFCVLRVYVVAKNQPSFEAQELPVAAVQYIRQQHPPGPIFNSYEWGGYLIWTLYPEYRVYVDGRSDMYGDQFLTDFVGTYKAENDWRSILGRFGVRTAVLPLGSPLAVALETEPKWHVAFRDSLSVVLVQEASGRAKPAEASAPAIGQIGYSTPK